MDHSLSPPHTLDILETGAAVLLALAVLHTFCTGVFARLAQRRPALAWLWHPLAEVELVFALWAGALMLLVLALAGPKTAGMYLMQRSYTEPLFVFAIMVVAASRPVLWLAQRITRRVAGWLPWRGAAAEYCSILSVIPLLGSLITEPAAMTLAAMMLARRLLRHLLPGTLRYGTLGVLFVNISIGGALTPFAAPPILMVAGGWGWDLPFMLHEFGLRVVPVVVVNAAVITLLFRKTLATVPADDHDATLRPPAAITLLHLALLATIVVFAHQPEVIMGLLALFLTQARWLARHQDRLLLREALLVAVFLAGLVVLGGLQGWWLQPLLADLAPRPAYLGATALTAVTDNAALTYLAAQVPDLSPHLGYYIVAGAISGGGLTVIANAPNPAGLALLRPHFPGQSVHPAGLLLAALPPTLLVMAVFLLT
jgi:Putative Na+/H+ antiporter